MNNLLFIIYKITIMSKKKSHRHIVISYSIGSVVLWCVIYLGMKNLKLYSYNLKTFNDNIT